MTSVAFALLGADAPSTIILLAGTTRFAGTEWEPRLRESVDPRRIRSMVGIIFSFKPVPTAQRPNLPPRGPAGRAHRSIESAFTSIANPRVSGIWTYHPGD